MSKGMKLFIKLICFVVVLAIAGPFVLKGPDGRALISLERIAPGLMDSFYGLKKLRRDAKEVARDATGNEHLGETKVFRTVNENGTVQFTNVEPKEKEYEVIWVDPDTNLIQGEPVVEVSDSEGNGSKAKDKKSIDDALPPMLTISPERVEKLIKDAENLQKLADERGKTLDGI